MTMNRRKFLVRGMTAGGFAVIALPGFGQDKFPNKPIHIISAYPPGGAVDVAARSVGDAMRQLLGQPSIVENKVGANGMIGAQYVAQALPDGYTLLMGSPSETTIAPHLYKHMPYDPLKDLLPISLCLKAPNVLVVGNNVPIKNTAELLAMAKAKPGILTCGSSGVGSIQHLNLEYMNTLAGVKILHVPYKGASPSVTDTIGGQITMTFASALGVLPLIKGGKLRPIAVTSLERVPALPDVPTLASTTSLAGYDLNNWDGLFVPAKTPMSIAMILQDAAMQAIASPDLHKSMLEGGAIPVGNSSKQFVAFIATESKKFAQIIEETKITLEL